MSTAMKRIDKIKAGFIHQNLTPIIVLLTYETIFIINIKANINKVTVNPCRVNDMLVILQASILQNEYSNQSEGFYFDISLHRLRFVTNTRISPTGPTVTQNADKICTYA